MTAMLTAFSMRRNLNAMRELMVVLCRHRGLIYELTKRAMTSEYTGQVLGAVWAVLHPLFWTLLYAVIFTYVFKLRAAVVGASPFDYTTYILVGMIPWISFQQVMILSCTALTSESSLVKQVVFPIEILPVKAVLLGFLAQLFSTAALLVYVSLMHGMPPATYLLLPFLFLIQLAAMGGVAFAFSAIGVFFRDLKDFARLFGVAGVFLIPVLYFPESVPEGSRFLLYLNPFTYLTLCYQDALYYGQILHPWAWVVFIGGSTLCLVLGFRLFSRSKPYFGNVL